MYGFKRNNLPPQGTVSIQSLAWRLDVGPNKLYDYLREKGLLDINNTPTPKYKESGHFECIAIELPNGRYHVYWLVTPMGVELILKMVLKDGKDYVQNRNLRKHRHGEEPDI